ncbi:Catabolic 3-dehydroquinase [Talaromyces atroroseus]|uniref:Catabolic 3-dehydroquinase n=1 Tax=Talaromyces atroroseus TaxID=1441469 RepID=A0A225AVK5_TALAT|nr:Catabolic 3-dehydroquinase [Talaromyces atroroseus]OKL57517.1 Catabolic 3-dehydroquinase [Talaromyces atroroseus]
MPSILILNGPNLNLLGLREPHIYGSETLQDVENTCRELGSRHNVSIETFQSNHEGHLIDRIHEARNKADVIVINPAGYTHTSVAIRDALLSVSIPFIEVHLSNVHAREQWRHHSYFSDKAAACIVGLGTFGYEAAIQFAVRKVIPKTTA